MMMLSIDASGNYWQPFGLLLDGKIEYQVHFSLFIIHDGYESGSESAIGVTKCRMKWKTHHKNKNTLSFIINRPTSNIQHPTSNTTNTINHEHHHHKRCRR
jgi:ribulose bisphosphate carboxylase small subunit